MGGYVLDFACFAARLAVEVDGGQHADSDTDRARDAWLKAQGFRVLRFWNNEVLGNIEGVLQRILEALEADASPPPRPSPVEGEGGTVRRSRAKAIRTPHSSAEVNAVASARPPLSPSPSTGEGRGGGATPPISPAKP